MQADTKIKIVGIFEIIASVFTFFGNYSFLYILSGFIKMDFVSFLGNFDKITISFFALIFLLSVFMMVSGIGLLMRNNWARVCSIISAFLIFIGSMSPFFLNSTPPEIEIIAYLIMILVIFFPFGYLFAILSLVFLFRDDVKKAFK